jgi:hypothetical protein
MTVCSFAQPQADVEAGADDDEGQGVTAAELLGAEFTSSHGRVASFIWLGWRTERNLYLPFSTTYVGCEQVRPLFDSTVLMPVAVVVVVAAVEGIEWSSKFAVTM